MKKTLWIGIFLLIPHIVPAQFIKAELEVSGLTCSMCSLATQKALSSLDFVKDIQPDLNKNVYYFGFKTEKEVTIDAIKSKVKSAGFSVNNLVVQFHFEKPVNTNSFDFQGNHYEILNPTRIPLSGMVRFQILEKDYLPSGLFKKQKALYPNALLDKDPKASRMYHLIQLK